LYLRLEHTDHVLSRQSEHGWVRGGQADPPPIASFVIVLLWIPFEQGVHSLSSQSVLATGICTGVGVCDTSICVGIDVDISVCVGCCIGCVGGCVVLVVMLVASVVVVMLVASVVVLCCVVLVAASVVM
jgi:hypothetical protein